jgi:hypothetical protein
MMVREREIVIPEEFLYPNKVFLSIIMKRYLTEFDYAFLNRFTLPLFGSASREKRAMQFFRQGQKKEFQDELRLLDGKEVKEELRLLNENK